MNHKYTCIVLVYKSLGEDLPVLIQLDFYNFYLIVGNKYLK